MKKVHAAMRPSVALSPDDARELRALSSDLERELLRSYETFRFRDGGAVDERQWKPIKTQEDFQCYRERKSYKRQAAGGAPRRCESPAYTSPRDSEDSIEIGPQAALATNCKMPLLMGTGTIAGTLNDALYGGSFHDTRSLRARNTYIHEVMEETAVLGVVDGPTYGEPFRFLGVIWYYKTYPIPGLILNRDVLMVAAIHETELSNGERVSVALHHSIEHRDAPERRDLSILRADFSLALLYRQIDPLRLEMFVTMFVDPKGSTPGTFVLPDTVRSMLTTTTICEAGFRRKLFRRMLEAQQQRRRHGSSVHEDDRNCALCDKKTSGLFAFSGSTCQICRRRVCSKCSITKDLLIESTRSSYTSKPFDFCLVCTLETRDVPAVTLAREELYERSLFSRSQHSSSVSSTSIGPLD